MATTVMGSSVLMLTSALKCLTTVTLMLTAQTPTVVSNVTATTAFPETELTARMLTSALTPHSTNAISKGVNIVA